MKLPTSLQDKPQWNIIGPVSPELPSISRPTLAVDGGASFVPNFDVWIGDNDSYLEKIDSKNAFFFPTDKSVSDLALGLSLFETTQNYTLHLYGFLGERRDHELFNIGEISLHLKRKKENKVILYRGQTPLFIFFGAGTHQLTNAGTVSIGTLYPQNITLSGKLDYTGTFSYAPLSSLGLSNIASGPYQIQAEAPFFIYGEDIG